jgi:galactokinase
MTSADLRAAAIGAFSQQFGSKPSHLSRAPGRVNIIGEHTDYNDGFVLPAAIEQAIYVAGKLRSDNTITIQSPDFNSVVTFTLDQLRDESLPESSRYPRGVLWVLGEEGHKLRGMDLTITGNVPLGAGFSSSAAVEVALFEMASALLGISLSQREKALLGVQVEHRFIGVRTGVMDQMISALGQEGHALLLDCRSLETTSVPIPKGITLMALDTGKRRQLVESEYGTRRAQCEEAARLLNIKALRDITPEHLAANADKLPEVISRRASHVVNENARTLAAVDALRSGDLQTVGRLINESHASLRDLYEVSIHELDIMAELAQKTKGCYGARMMGGGFGGAVIALVDDAATDQLAQEVAEAYNAATHLKAYVYKAKPGPGSSVEKLS